MRLSREVSHCIDSFLSEYGIYQRTIAYVSLDKPKVGMSFQICQTFAVPRIGKGIQNNHAISRVFLAPVMYKI